MQHRDVVISFLIMAGVFFVGSMTMTPPPLDIIMTVLAAALVVLAVLLMAVRHLKIDTETVHS